MSAEERAGEARRDRAPEGVRPAPHVPEVPEAQGVATPPMSATPRRRARTGTGEDEALRGYWRLVGRHYRWNVGVNALQGATALFSMALFMPETVLTAYMTTLTDSKLLIGLPWALSLFYWSFSALFYTRRIESCRQRMGVTQALSAPTRLAFTLMAASAWVAGYGPVVAIVVFFIGEALLTLTGGGAAVSWQDLLGRVFPPSKRGWAFGMREGFGHLSGFCGTAFMLWYLKGRGHDPQSYMWPFTVGAIVYWLSLVALWMTREPRWPYEAPKLPPRRQYYADMFSVLRTNANFRTYVVVKCLIASTAIFNFGLFVPYAIEHFGVSQAFAAGVFSAIALAGRICAAPIAGRLADRKGLKVPLLTGLTLVAGLLCVGLSLEYFAGYAVAGFVAIYFMSGFASTSMWIADFNLLLEFGRIEDRVKYITVAVAIAAPVGLAAGTLSGLMVDHFGYRPVMLVALVVSAAVWGIVYKVFREPRARGASALEVPTNLVD